MQRVRFSGACVLAALPALLSALGSADRKELERYPAGWRGWGTSRVTHRYTEGTFTMDLRDRRRHGLVWRAVAVSDLREVSAEQKVTG